MLNIFAYDADADVNAPRVKAASCPSIAPPCPFLPCSFLPRCVYLKCTHLNTRFFTHHCAHARLLQVLFDLPDFMIISAYTLLAVVWAEAFLQVCASFLFFVFFALSVAFF